MKTLALTLAATLAAAVACGTAQAATEAPFQRLALCQDSWLDGKDDPARMGAYTRQIEAQLARGTDDGAFVPKTPLKVLGLPVAQVYPQSVGMGVGFSVVVDAGFAAARSAVEQQLGRTLSCSTSDGVRACELQLGARKTAMLMTGQNGNAKTSLVGCYYFYQQ